MTERLAVEANGTRVDEQRFPGRQGRIVFAYLAAQNGRPVPRDELADLVWGDELPATWEKALRVLMTKLRTLLTECGIDGSSALTSAFGCYQLTLPPGAWIDVHAAATAVEQAEAALAAGALEDARTDASTAAELARRVFLPGEDGPWVEDRRRDLRDILVRALECLRDVALAGEEFGDAVRYAAEITELEPFRESSYRALMQAHAAAGDPAEALRVYERCRRFLADELGAYPSAESQAVYLELLRSSPGSDAAEAERLEADGDSVEPVPPAGNAPRRGREVALVAGAVVVAAVAAAIAVVLTTRHDPPPRVLPTSLVRLDPRTLKPTQVVKIGPRADLVVAAGGYVWVAHGSLRYTSDGLRDAGDRALTRIDPSTGESRGVGGLAPCGLTADPSGDVWVANCFASGQRASVVRVDARTLVFERTRLFPPTDGYYRGLAYGGGSLWAAAVSGGAVQGRGLTQLGPGERRRSIALAQHPNALAWSEGYGELWMTNFDDGSVSRMNPETQDVQAFEAVANNPGALVVKGASVWAGDWNAPDVVRLPAVGAAPPRHVSFDVTVDRAGVTSVAAGAGAIWATVPDDHALWRIDPETNRTKRIELGYYPWGVAVD
ncbi:MAG TPA: BTAD domain-containing putative transcriptional regulator, partial [Gaiellaceae bacterium]|nr:BTAD domain-containing putative transcriptional regulator [Gaiellaceae bacterium]